MPSASVPGALPATRALPVLGQARTTLTTIRDLVRWAVTRLQASGAVYGQGTTEAWDEAAWLVLWSLHLPLERLEPMLDARVTPDEVDATLALIERRCTERVPTAYLTGEAWLRGLRFEATPAALIPRSLLAELIDPERLAPWIDPDAVEDVLDLCTGGASLAVVAAHALPGARVVATDLSEPALALASRNVAAHGLEHRVALRRGDLFAPLAGEQFDLIVCNPPYVNADSMQRLPPEFLHEPRSALAAGTDGMDLVRRLLAEAGAHLRGHGVLLLEIGHEAAHFEAAFPTLEFTYVPTAGGDDQVVLITRDALP